MPIKRAGNLLLLEVKADSVIGNFILDTGAPHLVLNKTYFRNYPTFGSVYASGITGSASPGVETRLGTLDFGGIYFNDVDADMISLSHLEEKKGVKILGLIGLNLFKNLEILIDIERSTITLYRLSRTGEPLMLDEIHSKQPKQILEIEDEAGVLVITGVLNSKRLRMYIDTGAESCVINSGASRKALEKVKITGSRRLIGAGGKQIEVLSGKVEGLEFKNFQFKSLPVTIANLNGLSTSYGTKIDGMLGYDFLASGRMSFNLNKKKMYIW
ncbi:MAG: pepsin/retropepsin-like aspartic protease family protein [Bacteroidia bacterium]